jgi:hypothetical protein
VVEYHEREFLMRQKTVCLFLSILALAAGALGMSLSFFQLAFSMGSMEDIVAGGAGFLTGSVLVGAGLVSLAILSAREPGVSRHEADQFRRYASPDD